MVTLACILALMVVLIVVTRRRTAKSDAQAPSVQYFCKRCEHPYALPDLPRRCPRCDGNIDRH